MTTGVIHYSSDYGVLLLGGLHGQLISGEFCDVALDIGGREFPTHRNVLAAASPYFHVMFTGGLAESSEKTIVIHGMLPDTFEILLNFMYSGSLEITDESCQDLLAGADLFGLSSALEACCNYLQQQLHPSNCLGIFQLAEIHSCLDLKKTSVEYIQAHFLDITKEQEFLNLPKEKIVYFLANEHVHIEHEMQMLSAALLWIKHDIISRRSFIFELLTVIRFPMLPHSALSKCIEQCEDLSIKIAVRKVAQDFDEAHRKSPRVEKLRREQPFLFQIRKGAKRKFMVVGGLKRDLGSKWNDSITLSSVEILDTTNSTDSTIPAMKYGRSSHGMAVLNGLVYIIGGENDSLILDSVECYDPMDNKWTIVSSMVQPRCGHGVAVIHDLMYAIGGWVGSKMGDTIEVFDPQTNIWEVVDEMKTPRYHLGVVAYEGLMYVVGGVGEMGQEVTTTESYNPLTRQWCRLANLHTPRAHMGICAGDEMIYVVGGANEDDGPLSTIERYDIFQDEWTLASYLPVERVGAAASFHNGCVYVFGGQTGGSGQSSYTLKNVDCYDTVSHHWTELQPLCAGRCDAAVLVL